MTHLNLIVGIPLKTVLRKHVELFGLKKKLLGKRDAKKNFRKFEPFP
jgi:hypothetical protein